MQRRHLLQALAAAPFAGAAHAAPRIPNAGVQLYTVRDLLKKDFRGTLARIAALGYREVEFAGYFDQHPATIRAFLAALNITAPSAHVGDALFGPDAQRTIDAAVTVGHKYLVCPWVPQEQWRDLDGWLRRADAFNRAGELCRKAGLQFCYHNHHFEFASIDGQRPYDLLLRDCDPALVQMELDVFWAAIARAEPHILLAKYPGRFPMLHLKQLKAMPRMYGADVLSLNMDEAHAQMADVGPGGIDFAALLALPATQSVKHFFVEHDKPTDAMASIEASLRYLQGLQA